MWGNALLSMDRDPARFGAFRNALRAQVFDSPPDYGRIAGGVARSMGYGGVRETAIKSVGTPMQHKNSQEMNEVEYTCIFYVGVVVQVCIPLIKIHLETLPTPLCFVFFPICR